MPSAQSDRAAHERRVTTAHDERELGQAVLLVDELGSDGPQRMSTEAGATSEPIKSR
jgi:hypothetical protein